MEEDLLYQRIMTAPPRRPSQPPAYQELRSSPGPSDGNGDGSNAKQNKDMNERRPSAAAVEEGGRRKSKSSSKKIKIKSKSKSKAKDKAKEAAELERRRRGSSDSCAVIDDDDSEALPNYSSSIMLEGVFSKKHEIENTIKRAEDRQWHTSFVTLNGTALSLYTVKKDWGWGKTRDGPTISPDNPPWVRKAKLEKTYSLLHADAGIAADYKK